MRMLVRFLFLQKIISVKLEQTALQDEILLQAYQSKRLISKLNISKTAYQWHWLGILLLFLHLVERHRGEKIVTWYDSHKNHKTLSSC